jgi:hypothetical protein
MAKPPAQVYQIRVTLNGTRPPVWRRLQVPGDTTLRKLHDILQIAMGWTDSHLHQFIAGGEYYGATEYDEEGDLKLLPEQRYRLNQLVQQRAPGFSTVRFRRQLGSHPGRGEDSPPEPGVTVPLCLAGQRACPPEDVGGVGYAEFSKPCAVRATPSRRVPRVGGGDFDRTRSTWQPSTPGCAARGAAQRAGVQRLGVDGAGLEGRQPSRIRLGTGALQRRPGDGRNLPLRSDMLSLLAYLRDERVIGTQATGNLPLKAVRAVCARLVSPPKLDAAIGDKVYAVRSETEVWPLYFLHLLASIAGLVTGGPARRWRLTPSGERFLAAQAPSQVWLMLATWWTRVNWLVAFPGYMVGAICRGFGAVALKRLLALPAGDSVPFDPFAGRLVAEGLLVWPIQDQEMAQRILRGLVERAVILPLRDFGVLATEYGPHPVLGPRYSELVAFRVTPFGKGLLAALREATR